MTVLRGWWRLLVVGLVAGCCLTLTAAAWADDSVTPMCNGEACGPGWYTSPVFVSWSWSGGTATSGCASQDYTSDTNQTTLPVSELPAAAFCSVSFPDGTVSSEYLLKLELSSPTVTATLARPPDSNGWYNHPVAVSFSGSSFSGIASCSPAQTYAGPDAVSASVTGSCTDNAGVTTPASATFQYDATPPTVTGAPSRAADFDGWYNHPVTFAFTGTDDVSGIQSCSTVTYSGPDTSTGSVIGSCTDVAGNVGTVAVPLMYDASPPALSASADPGDGSVMIHWTTPAQLSSFEILRTPGLNGAAGSVIDRGGSGSYDDTHVRNGVHYHYTLTAQDQAGNVSVFKLVATAGPRLLDPANDARMSAPPLLRWTAVPRATYYNIQLYHRGKVLSLWPSHAQLQLKRSWSFGGRRLRLKPGRYRWYVWPGFGDRAAANYGQLIGSGSFVVTRAG